MPSIEDYYEPWTYDYENLTTAPLQDHVPVARPKSLISGEDMAIGWSANWDDNPERHHGTLDPATCNLRDWFDATEEPIRGSITFPVRPEFDNDHYLFHVDQEAAS